MFVKTLAAASLLVISASLSHAGPAYKAEDVVQFFAGAKPGATRGICVGTPEECGVSDPKPKALSFNLMVNFEKNSAQLTSDAMANLDEFSKALRDPRLNSARFAVDGYADASGTEDYNLKLSDRRARSVVSYLASRGVPEVQLIPKGFGEADPIAPDPYDPVNRRVVTSLVAR
jgi:outer membrane protein OmpA-like peptidoglycan-associated protein